MGKTKKATSAKKCNKIAKGVKKQLIKEKGGKAPPIDGKIQPNVRTRSKRSAEQGRDEQPLPKQIKLNKTEATKSNADQKTKSKATKAKLREANAPQKQKSDEDSIDHNNNATPVHEGHSDAPVVGSAKSLIDSIKSGKISRKRQNEAITTVDNVDQEEDGISVGVGSAEDEYSEIESDSYSESNTGSESESDRYANSESDSQYSDRRSEFSEEGEYISPQQTPRHVVDRPRPGTSQGVSQSRRESLKKDPEVQKLLKEMMDEEMSKGGHGSRRSSTPQQKGKKELIMKSPSDTTIYAPALALRNSPNLINKDKLSVRIGKDSSVNDVSNFVEHYRRDSGRTERSPSQERSSSKRRHQRGHDGDDARSRSKKSKTPESRARRHNPEEASTTRGRRDRHHQNDYRDNPAEQMVIDAEKYKASVAPPKGRSDNNPDVDHLISMIQTIRSKYEDNEDDDFFHVTCHVDMNLKEKISKGEFVDLERLLPKNRSQMMSDSDKTELIHNGNTYLLPGESNEKYTRINSIRKWEQAFRIYAAIYSEANPDRSAEIWQYVHVINTAAASYVWENVSYYDVTFRQLMHARPNRSWARIYTQMWNLALSGHHSGRTAGPSSAQGGATNANRSSQMQVQKTGDWRDRCCWRYNKGKCTKWNCKWDHRCSNCGGYSHGKHNCRKRENKGQSPNKSSSSTSKSSQKQ